MRRFWQIIWPAIGIFAGMAIIYGLTRPQVVEPDFPEVREALDTLADYGYESQQVVGKANEVHLAWCVVMCAGLVVVYLGVYGHRERRKIWRVIDYAREINRRVYNLKLDENSEDELSLLSNELYKTTVLLQEAAETDRKRARLMETALADISHQLRTPLTSLQLMIDNLYDNAEMDVATRQEFLRSAGRLVEQMSGLTVMLLNLAKLDNGTLKMKPERVRAGDLVDEVTGRLAILAEVTGVEMEVSGELDAIMRVDPRWQAEAITNIVKNCLEHSPSGSKVRLAVRDTTVFCKLTISDSGEGIPAEEVRHVFERFYRASNAAPESVGIGLALARQLIEAEGGQVRVKSRLGVGTEFVVTYYKTK